MQFLHLLPAPSANEEDQAQPGTPALRGGRRLCGFPCALEGRVQSSRSVAYRIATTITTTGVNLFPALESVGDPGWRFAQSQRPTSRDHGGEPSSGERGGGHVFVLNGLHLWLWPWPSDRAWLAAAG